jgi:hypothetical protein
VALQDLLVGEIDLRVEGERAGDPGHGIDVHVVDLLLVAVIVLAGLGRFDPLAHPLAGTVGNDVV